MRTSIIVGRVFFGPILLILFEMPIGLAVELAPGVYVVGRDLQGAAFVGTHQFVLMVPNDPAKFKSCRDLGNGKLGLIVSTINKDSRLLVEWFDSGDWQAMKEYVNPEKYVSRLKSDFDTEVATVDIGTKNVDDVILVLLKSIELFAEKESKKNIRYPGNASNMKNGADLLNSNSWAQSLIEHNVGRGRVKEDFSGADNGHQNRIPIEYFK